jgi:4-oxalocrotonate tautomerase
MPLVRINLSSSISAQEVHAISDTVYEALRTIVHVPGGDKFQVITRHAPDELIYPLNGYLGVTYTPGIVFIQVTWNAGRTTEMKKDFYKAIANGIQTRTGIRKEDVVINLLDVAREDWSFGNGDMQYA